LFPLLSDQSNANIRHSTRISVTSVVSLRFSLSSGCSYCDRGRASGTRGPDVERWIEKRTGKNTLLGEANKCRALKCPQRVANQTLTFRNMNNTWKLAFSRPCCASPQHTSKDKRSVRDSADLYSAFSWLVFSRSNFA